MKRKGAFSLSLVRHSCIEASVVLELKSQTLLKSGLLSLHQGSESFVELGGLEALKAFCCKLSGPRPQEHRWFARVAYCYWVFREPVKVHLPKH